LRCAQVDAKAAHLAAEQARLAKEAADWKARVEQQAVVEKAYVDALDHKLKDGDVKAKERKEVERRMTALEHARADGASLSLSLLSFLSLSTGSGFRTRACGSEATRVPGGILGSKLSVVHSFALFLEGWGNGGADAVGGAVGWRSGEESEDGGDPQEPRGADRGVAYQGGGEAQRRP
jgi:hypothetical protein